MIRDHVNKEAANLLLSNQQGRTWRDLNRKKIYRTQWPKISTSDPCESQIPNPNRIRVRKTVKMSEFSFWSTTTGDEITDNDLPRNDFRMVRSSIPSVGVCLVSHLVMRPIAWNITGDPAPWAESDPTCAEVTRKPEPLQSTRKPWRKWPINENICVPWQD